MQIAVSYLSLCVLISVSSAILPKLKLVSDLGIPLSVCRPPVVNLNTVLPAAKIDWSSLTVSGFSSGAIMAAQIGVAHSAEIKGIGVLAGWAYGQFYENPLGVPTGALRFVTGAFPYSSLPVLSAVLDPLLRYANVAELEAQAEIFSKQGLIDDLRNLNRTKVFIYSGTTDLIINNEHGYHGRDFFEFFGSDVVAVLTHLANHVLPTDNSPFPSPPPWSCALTIGAFADCGYEVVFDMFKHFYGKGYVAPVSSTAPFSGSLFAFAQANLTATGNIFADFMDEAGYLYVPARCQVAGNTCKIHIALHGCLEDIYNSLLCNVFVMHTGYLQVADANDVVIVFPQASAMDISLVTTQTNFGCWDFYGGVSPDFCLKTGTHLSSIWKIAKKVAGLL